MQLYYIPNTITKKKQRVHLFCACVARPRRSAILRGRCAQFILDPEIWRGHKICLYTSVTASCNNHGIDVAILRGKARGNVGWFFYAFGCLLSRNVNLPSQIKWILFFVTTHDDEKHESWSEAINVSSHTGTARQKLHLHILNML